MNKKYVIENIYSADLLCNKVSLYEPEDYENVFFQFYFDVACKNSNQSTEFQGVICTPKGLECSGKYHENNLLSDRAILVYRRYCYQDVINDLNRILKACSTGDNIDDVAIKMQRYFIWEYESVGQ